MDPSHDLSVFRRDFEREIESRPVPWRSLPEYQKVAIINFAFRRALQTRFLYAREELPLVVKALNHLLELSLQTELAAFEAGNKRIASDFNWREVIEASDSLGKNSYLTSLYPK